MTTLTPQQLKKALVAAGFEIFRTRGDEIVLAERVRENLILDSGVRLRAGAPLEVRVVLRAQRADFPAEDERLLFSRLRQLATTALEPGYTEVSTAVTPITDPGDPAHVLDTHYEVVFAKPVEEMSEAISAIARVLASPKTAAPEHHGAVGGTPPGEAR